MTLMGKYCCCTSCGCLPSTITMRIPAYTYADNTYAPTYLWQYSYLAQDIVLYKCCVSFNDCQHRYVYRSNKIASGTFFAYNNNPPYNLLFTKPLYAFFLAYNVGYDPSNFYKCYWYYSAHIGVAIPFNYTTYVDCGTYNDLSTNCPITTLEKSRWLSGYFDSPLEPGRVFNWTQTSTTNCSPGFSGVGYLTDNSVNGPNPQSALSCVVGPSPFTFLGDGTTPDIVGIEIL